MQLNENSMANRLRQLICILCPNGVEYAPLSKVCISLTKGTLKTGDLNEFGAYPVINSGRELYGRYQEYNNEGNAFTVAARGEYAGFVTYIPEKFWAGGLCYPYRSKDENVLSTKFIYHFLKSQEAKIMGTLVARGSIPALNKTDLDKFHIPLPPLPVQQEIVRILDNYSTAVSELKATLSVELTARIKQYEHYRDELLIAPTDSVTMTLGEITEFIRNGYNYKADGDRSKKYKISRIETISTGQINMDKVGSSDDISERYLMKDGDILFSHINSLPYLGNVAYYSTECGELYHGMNLLCFRSKPQYIIPKYLFHVLKSSRTKTVIRRYAKQSCNQYSLTTSDIKSWKIVLPPLDKQFRIVEILDRFDTLCNDITSGLPAEIEARQKQYEYYRDKLLNFKELEA